MVNGADRAQELRGVSTQIPQAGLLAFVCIFIRFPSRQAEVIWEQSEPLAFLRPQHHLELSDATEERTPPPPAPEHVPQGTSGVQTAT